MKKYTLLLTCVLTVCLATAAYAAPNVPGAVYSDQQAAGVNKPIMQIQQELQMAGVKDVKPTDWCAGSITVILQAGLLKPAPDGSFNPDGEMNAGDGVAVFAKVLGVAAKDDTPDQAMAKMQDAGLVDQGTSTDRGFSRMEVAKLIGKALGVEPQPINPADCPFRDSGALSREDAGLLKALYDIGIFKGYLTDGVRTFRPGNILTRAEIAILIDRILGTH